MNNNINILNRGIFNLPVERGNIDFIKFIEQKFNEYNDSVYKFDGELGEYVRSRSDTIASQMNCIYSSLHSYYNGLTAKAYDQISGCFFKTHPYLWIQSKSIMSGRDKLYRMRVGGNEVYLRKDLFHIPFELRNKVRRQRYSIPGLPCLYLSTSVYTCWEEMNRPNINTVHVARYDLNEADFKFLFIDQRTEVIRKMLQAENLKESKETIDRHISNFIISFPILLACSVKVLDYNSDFIPEYIIPQLLLQWIKSTDTIDGIQYSSNRTKFAISPVSFETETNIIIPTKEFDEFGYCPILSKKIKLTDPVSLQLLELSNPNILHNRVGFFNLLLSSKNRKSIELIKGLKSIYANTTFGIIEKQLDKMTAKLIDS